jgi:hypothetical protein
MQAINAFINDTLLAGEVWNANGSVNNANVKGGFLALHRESSNVKEIRIKDLWAYGETVLGTGLNSIQGSILFLGKRTITVGNYEKIGSGMHLQGNYTALNFYNAINNYLSGENNTAN